MPHGGERTPERPAAVSGPGRLSRRTDRRFEFEDDDTGEHGNVQETKALQDSAVPPPGEGNTGAGTAGASRPPSSVGAVLEEDVFGPSRRTSQPGRSIGNAARRAVPDDPDRILRALFAKYRHPDLARLLARRRRRA